MQRKIDNLRKKLQRNKRRADREATKKEVNSPNKTVNELIEGCSVTLEVRQRLLFGEVMISQLKETSYRLPKNSKEKELFQKCLSGTKLKKYRVSQMAKKFLSKNRDNSKLLTSNNRKHPIFTIATELRHKVRDFFERDDVSRMCPGKKDCLKNEKPKRLLLDTVNNLHPKFISETGIKLSYPTLLRVKPSWVMWPKNKDRGTCLCVRHENFELILDKLKSLSELIKANSCEVESYHCMFGLCPSSGKIEIELCGNDDTVDYFERQTRTKERVIKGKKKAVKLTKKCTVKTTVKDLKEKMLLEIADMKKLAME